MHDEEGDKQESLDWLDLPMLIKLDSMHIVTEWQFDSPLRFRTLMRSDDDTASWVSHSPYSTHKNMNF